MGTDPSPSPLPLSPRREARKSRRATAAIALFALLALCLSQLACGPSFNLPKYKTVAFNLNCSDATGAPSAQQVAVGAAVKAPSEPLRSGYSFGGWYREPDCSTAWSFSVDSVTDDITLYAKWIPLGSRVSYHANGADAGEVPLDLNYYPEGSTVTVMANSGNLAKTGYLFLGWNDAADAAEADYSAGSTLSMGAADLELYAIWKLAEPSSPGQIWALEFGRTSGSKDYCNAVALPSDFGKGALFSVWTKIPKALSIPTSDIKLRGNMEVFYLDGANWHLICLDGNVNCNPQGMAIYNANFMLGTTPSGGRGDYCTYQTPESERLPLATFNDWVWVAWQVVVNADNTMTLRQWLKYGLDGEVFAAGNYWLDPSKPPEKQYTPLDPLGEEIVSIPGWTPSAPSSFRIGTDNTYSGLNSLSNSYLCHARLEARSTKPSLPELEAIAAGSAASISSAWGDWELNWKDGADDAPNLLDRSGHGRHLSLQSGGALYRGPLSPEFP